MLTVRVGNSRMGRQNILGKVFRVLLVLVPAVILFSFALQKYSKDDPVLSAPEDSGPKVSSQTMKPPKAGSCVERLCPQDQFSFSIQSGAANVVAPKMCFQNKLVLGPVLDNAGVGINVVLINGRTGDVLKTDHHDMYSGDVKPLIELLKTIEVGSIVLMASFDEPSSKLTEEARTLISELGSKSVASLGFRDNWVFVGGKGASVKNSFERYMKNDRAQNKYEDWPEIIDLQGCIPRFME